jgi:cytochrome c peroxidase
MERLVASLLLALLLPAALRAEELPFPAEMRLAPLPATPARPADNLMTPEKILLGRLLFFDPILSGSQTVACATCHHPSFAWTDGRATPLGVGASGLGAARRLAGTSPARRPIPRNVPSLLNVGFNGVVAGLPQRAESAPMFWDARTQGLEAQVLHPIQARDEMQGETLGGPGLATVLERLRAISEYRERFARAFGPPASEPITADRLTKAIAAFERTILAADSHFDRYLRRAEKLTEAEQRGLKIFEKAGCIQCHGGPMFSDFKLHFIGVADAGADGRRPLRTPTLRNLRQTAPYMHHGGLRTIDDVLVFYEALSDEVSETLDGGAEANPPLDPLLRKLDLRVEEFADLEAFLDALNDDHYDRSLPKAVPSGLPPGGQVGGS